MTPSDNIICATRAWTILSRSFQSGRMAGTYLFYGPDGVGRWLLSISLAALANCENPQSLNNGRQVVTPCGRCRNCRNVFSLNFEGLHFAVPIPSHKNHDEAVDLTNQVLAAKRAEPFRILSSSAPTNIPISIARDIRRSLSRKAGEGIVRVVLFYQMEKMKTASADALLKLIEEPPQDSIVILVCRKPDSLLPTIQSRAQKVKADKIPPEAIEKYLREKHEVSEVRSKLLARIAEGCVGRAIDMIETGDDDGSSRRAVIFFLFKSLFLNGSADVLAHMDEVLSLRDKGEAEELLRLWQALIRDCVSFAVSGDEDKIINVDFTTETRKLASFFSTPQLALDMVGNIKITLADLRRNVHIQGALMALALKLMSNIRAVS